MQLEHNDSNLITLLYILSIFQQSKIIKIESLCSSCHAEFWIFLTKKEDFLTARIWTFTKIYFYHIFRHGSTTSSYTQPTTPAVQRRQPGDRHNPLEPYQRRKAKTIHVIWFLGLEPNTMNGFCLSSLVEFKWGHAGNQAAAAGLLWQ